MGKDSQLYRYLNPWLESTDFKILLEICNVIRKAGCKIANFIDDKVFQLTINSIGSISGEHNYALKFACNLLYMENNFKYNFMKLHVLKEVHKSSCKKFCLSPIATANSCSAQKIFFMLWTEASSVLLKTSSHAFTKFS